jgi:hypothetical protein
MSYLNALQIVHQLKIIKGNWVNQAEQTHLDSYTFSKLHECTKKAPDIHRGLRKTILV